MTAPDWSSYPAWRERFGDVLDPRRYSLAWLDGMVRQGRVLMWGNGAAAIIAQVRGYPTGARDLHGLVAAGDIEAIVRALIPQAEEWARAAGCIGAVIESRQGWARVLKSAGYRPYQTAVRKDL